MQMLQIKEIAKINEELKVAEKKALEGKDPELNIDLEDENLNYDIYQQIISKIYAVIRYSLYQAIKEQTDNFADTLSEDDLKEIVKALDIE